MYCQCDVRIPTNQSGYFSLCFVRESLESLKVIYQKSENTRKIHHYLPMHENSDAKLEKDNNTMKFNNKKSIIFYFVESVEQTPRLLRFKNMLISENVGLPCSSRFQHSSNSSQMSLSQCSGWESST